MGFNSRIISLPYLYDRSLPDFQKGDDLKFPDGLVRYFLNEFTKPGGKVLDPFAGLGTTFFVCEEMGRIPYGVEADAQRHAWTIARVKSTQNLKFGDSYKIPSFGFPKMDFSITSPPYMPQHHQWNPLFAGNPRHNGYAIYLKRLKAIYSRLQTVMKRGAYIVVQADNLENKGYTPLVWDIAKTLSDIINLEGEVIVRWDGGKVPSPGYTHCLVFRNK